MNRRTFINHSTAIGLLSHGALYGACFGQSESRYPIGLIMNTVKKEMAADYKGTLKALREMGYEYLEGGHFGGSKKKYRRYCKDLGFRNVCGGSSMGALMDRYDEFMETADALEYEFLICYYPWLHGNDEIDVEASYVAAENLNALGKKTKESGFRLAWHPHNWEYLPDDNGQTPLGVIMENTDPEYVALEMDLYWAVKAGADPIKIMETYPGRTELFHVKDLSGVDQSIACVGEGTIDFPAILDFAREQEIKYWIVENETEASDLACARVSAQHLKNII
ncbi:MAG: sugar phosphate isomerase/epimerase [Bacteroidota bacterium]